MEVKATVWKLSVKPHLSLVKGHFHCFYIELTGSILDFITATSVLILFIQQTEVNNSLLVKTLPH